MRTRKLKLQLQTLTVTAACAPISYQTAAVLSQLPVVAVRVPLQQKTTFPAQFVRRLCTIGASRVTCVYIPVNVRLHVICVRCSLLRGANWRYTSAATNCHLRAMHATCSPVTKADWSHTSTVTKANDHFRVINAARSSSSWDTWPVTCGPTPENEHSRATSAASSSRSPTIWRDTCADIRVNVHLAVNCAVRISWRRVSWEHMWGFILGNARLHAVCAQYSSDTRGHWTGTYLLTPISVYLPVPSIMFSSIDDMLDHMRSHAVEWTFGFDRTQTMNVKDKDGSSTLCGTEVQQ